MAIKGSKSTAAKVVKKLKKDLAAMKKPISKAAKRIAKDISAVKKPISKAAKKMAKDMSMTKKPAKAKKVAKKKVTAVKKPAVKARKVAKRVTKKKRVVKAAKRPVKSVAKKKTAKVAKRKPAKRKASAKKAVSRVKKNVKKSSKAKVGKKKVVKSKKSAKKAKAVKKSKSAKEEKAEEVAKALKKKSVKAVSKVTPKKAAAVVKEVGPVSKHIVAGPTSVKAVKKSPSIATILPPHAGTLLMNGTILPYKEKVGEEYMNGAQQAHFRKLLKAWKDQLMYDMVSTVHHMQDEAANFPDPNDRATQEEEFSLELRTRDRELKLVKKIEEAMQKLNNHEYGYCETCGVKIGIRRLEARPTAALCIDCKTLDEIRERQLTG